MTYLEDIERILNTKKYLKRKTPVFYDLRITFSKIQRKCNIFSYKI